jgi:hypothetical protein
LSLCNRDLGYADDERPSLCAICIFGPCEKKQTSAPVRYTDVHNLSANIAEKIFPHISDRERRDELAYLLTVFAEEIKRSAIEP